MKNEKFNRFPFTGGYIVRLLEKSQCSRQYWVKMVKALGEDVLTIDGNKIFVNSYTPLLAA